MNERRQSPRGEVEVQVSFVPPEGGLPLHLLSHNLGADGLLLITDHVLPPGGRFPVELALGESPEPIRCAAEVVWTQESPQGARYSVGITFRDLPDAGRLRIAAYVEAHRSHLADFLRGFPIFDALTDEDLQHLGALCFRQSLRKGSLFYREGEQGDTLFILEHGTVKIYRKAPDGEEQVVALASSGEIFGEMSLITARPHGASVRAVVDTRILGMTRGGYAFLKWQHPRTAVRFSEILIRFLCTRLERTTQRLLAPAPLERR